VMMMMMKSRSKNEAAQGLVVFAGDDVSAAGARGERREREGGGLD